MGVNEEVYKNVYAPNKIALEMRIEKIYAECDDIKKLLELDEDNEKVEMFTDLFGKKLKDIEEAALYQYDNNKHWELVGMIKALRKVINWKEDLQRDLNSLKNELKTRKQELKEGSGYDENPED